MAVGDEELVVVSGDTGQKADGIPTFKNEQEYNNWWNVTIQVVPPRHLNDLDVVAVIQGANNQIKRFPDIPSAQAWTNQLHLIKLHNGLDIRHNIPNHGIFY
jgi:hypothetical protein